MSAVGAAPRIPPGTRRDVGPFAWIFARIAGRVSGTNPPNLFLTLGRHPKLFRGWLRFAGRLMPGGVLPRRETELVILRVAHLRDGHLADAVHHLSAAVEAARLLGAVAGLLGGP